MLKKIWLCGVMIGLIVSADLCMAQAQEREVGLQRVYVGTYTRGESQGIYTFLLNSLTGEATAPELAAELVNPSFLAFSPNNKFLYAVNEVSDFPGSSGRSAGGVTGFALDALSGKLTKLNSQHSGGAGPCHVVVDKTGKVVVVANYGGGSVASYAVNEDGSLEPASSFIQHEGSSVNPNRQTAPHAHSVNIDANNRFAVVADLGLDKLLVYKLDTATGKLTPNDPPSVSTPAGGGPRHLSFHPNGKFAYSNNEILPSVTAYKYDAENGLLTPMMTLSSVPEGYNDPGNSTAEVLVHPSGKFLYVSNRGHDSIAMYTINADGTLEAIGHESTRGNVPRNFGIDLTGKYLLAANQNSGTIVIFEIDQQTGKLKATGNVVDVPSPVCVRMVPFQ